MSLRAYRTFQALILAGLGVYLFIKVIDGHILLYINQRFVILVLLAAVGLLLMAQLILRERPAPAEAEGQIDQAGRAGWALWLVALPLLFSLLAPERPPGAGVVERRGISTSAAFPIQGRAAGAAGIPAAQRSVLDWVRVVSESPDPAALAGQPADVTGFVYHDARLGPGRFLVGRLIITCCAADSSALGMAVAWPDAASLPDYQWVRVQGPVQLIQLDGETLAVVEAASVEPILEPEQPYLFP